MGATAGGEGLTGLGSRLAAEREPDAGHQQTGQHDRGDREAGHRQLAGGARRRRGGVVDAGVVDAGVVDAGVVVVGVVAGVVVVDVVLASTTTVPCMNGWIMQM